jgi:hypothetical protein
MSELCQLLGGGCKVIIAVKQHPQPLYTVRNKGRGLILYKKTSQLKWKGPNNAKKMLCDIFKNP